MDKQNKSLQSEGQNAVPPEPDTSKTNSAAGPLSREEEERRYWKQDVFYKKASLIVSIAGFLMIILGLFAN